MGTARKGTRMDEKLRAWQPNPSEVAAIVRELRPLIAELARRDTRELAAIVAHRLDAVAATA